MITGGLYGWRGCRNPVLVPLNAFRYEFFGLIRGLGDESPLHRPETCSRIPILLRVPRRDGTYAVPAGEIVPFTARSNRF